MDKPLRNALALERARRGWTQSRAAETARISRQSYAAIESGRSVPSTEVALRLAQGLGVPVESLFHLPPEPDQEVVARWSGRVTPMGRRVRLARIAGRLIARDAGESSRSVRTADGVVVGGQGEHVRVRLFPERPPAVDLVAAGCDPAFGIVADMLREQRDVDVLWGPLGSRAALEALARGEAHVAGMHLLDPATGEMNGPWVRAAVPFPCTRISFAEWDQGLLVAAGNPAGITGIRDLARSDLRFLNREPGSGSRQLLDLALQEAGIAVESVTGYATTVAPGHFAVGEAIASGLVDAGIGIGAAAAQYGLDMLTLRREPYELVIPDHFLDLPAVGALLDLLRGRTLRAQIGALPGYDVSRMGDSR